MVGSPFLGTHCHTSCENVVSGTPNRPWLRKIEPAVLREDKDAEEDPKGIT